MRVRNAEMPGMNDDRRKGLGQYFTPPTVIRFALQALTWLDEGVSQPDSRRIMDPARVGSAGIKSRRGRDSKSDLPKREGLLELFGHRLSRTLRNF